jgi:tripartite ATP-independent transporter DctM subunit
MIAFAFIALLVLIFFGIYIGAGLGILGALLDWKYASTSLMSALGDISWNASTDFILVALPLFVLMGEIRLRSGITEKMYEAINPWVSWLPGGLMHTNIGAAALFAATTGSSVATAATICTVSLPNMERQKYSEPLFLGSIAAGGTLGILIPPSVNMVVYAVLAKTSLGALYLGALIPGGIMVAMFSLVIVIACMVRPSWGGIAPAKVSWGLQVFRLVHLIPPLLLFLLVIAPIYFGWATPTEAAAFGVVGSFSFGIGNGRLRGRELLQCLEGAMRTTCMVMVIILGALFLNFIMVTVGLTDAITFSLLDMGLPPFALLIGIIIFYLILGCFMETLSMMIATTPIIVPIIVKLGYSEVWWGIVFVILMEAALITPPIGLNLFVVHSIRKRGQLRDVAIGALPFLGAMVVVIGVLIAAPQLVLWLPTMMTQR